MSKFHRLRFLFLAILIVVSVSCKKSSDPEKPPKPRNPMV